MGRGSHQERCAGSHNSRGGRGGSSKDIIGDGATSSQGQKASEDDKSLQGSMDALICIRGVSPFVLQLTFMMMVVAQTRFNKQCNCCTMQRVLI